MTHNPSPWWQPEAFARRRPGLETRARLRAAVRRCLEERGFTEVETPCLQISPGLETHIMALAVDLSEPQTTARQRLYLHTSPEFTMKKLLVAGMERIFQLAPVWRDGERTALHHPEFTMLEWYRAGGRTDDLIDDCAALLQAGARAAGVDQLRRGGRVCDPFARPQRLGIPQAFTQYCGLDLFASLNNPLQPDRDILAVQARSIGLFVSDFDSWDDVFFRIMMDRIEPHLGDGVPLVLCDYPLPLAALAKPTAADPRLADRFELYACGVELANAFGELTDPVEQRRRFVADQDLKEKLYQVRYPVDEDFMAALDAGMPDAAGIALGFDRLVLLLTGAERIDDILWAPVAGPL